VHCLPRADQSHNPARRSSQCMCQLVHMRLPLADTHLGPSAQDHGLLMHTAAAAAARKGPASDRCCCLWRRRSAAAAGWRGMVSWCCAWEGVSLQLPGRKVGSCCWSSSSCNICAGCRYVPPEAGTCQCPRAWLPDLYRPEHLGECEGLGVGSLGQKRRLHFKKRKDV
jgi:hypothetical protein